MPLSLQQHNQEKKTAWCKRGFGVNLFLSHIVLTDGQKVTYYIKCIIKEMFNK